MYKGGTGSKEFAVSYKSSLGKSSAFAKAGARITILSVLSRQVKNQTAILRNKERTKQTDFIETDVKPQDDQNVEFKDNSMNTTCTLPVHGKENSLMVNDKTDEVVDGDPRGSEGHTRVINGTSEMNGSDQSETGSDGTGVFEERSSTPTNEQEVSKNRSNSFTKQGKSLKNGNKTPFDFMKERKLSEPVLSPRKRSTILNTAKMTRCRSTVDLRENEKPIIRELGGYKFFQRPGDVSDSSKSTKTNTYRRSESQTNEMATLKKTIAEQKKTISNREKHILQLEKNSCLLESENAKNKKQIASFREKIRDCSATVDYLRREKEVLESEKDRLNFTLLTYEHELQELRSQNVNLVTEYENAEQSRKIAVGHLQEIEKASQGGLGDGTLKNPKEFIEQLNSVKECVNQLRVDREALQNEQKSLTLFFTENVKIFVDRVREMEMKQAKEQPASSLEENHDEEREILKQENTADSFQQAKNEEKEPELAEFKEKLKSNEKSIDQLANQIRDLEKKKKSLLENRFAMIQEFQAGGEVMDPEDWEGELSEKDAEEKVEDIQETKNEKKSSRVTRKIRKLERTLSMDHGVGKLDCITKLCKKLEDCEQKIHELETMNQELLAEHDDMEEEAKYLKYVLSYRSDTMKAQLQNEYESKVAALREELRVAKGTGSGTSEEAFNELSERNRALEDEVHRLHEQLKSLLLNLPALQGEDDQQSSPSSEHNASRDANDGEEATTNLVEKVAQLTEEKRILLLSMQTLTAQLESRESNNNLPENDSSFSKNLLVLEKTLRDVENENACFVETFQRIREVLEVDDEHRSTNEHPDSFKISKLKGEIQKLREKTDVSRRSIGDDSITDESLPDTCTRHEERISELEKEVDRLHEEKKSLLSTIIRLQADPNFTFSNDVTDDDVSRRSSPGSPVKASVSRDNIHGSEEVEASVSEIVTASTPRSARSFRDEEVQVNIASEDLGGLLGYLERDLDRLKTALSQQCFVKYEPNAEPRPAEVQSSRKELDIPKEIEKLSKKVKELEEHGSVLQEKLDESEAIRSDLHRAISIATDMATEERQKCADLMRSKAALEKDVLKLANENRDLRDGLETLSRVRKRRSSRAQYLSRASPSSEGGENEGPALYLPLVKPSVYSESEFSDIDSPVPS